MTLDYLDFDYSEDTEGVGVFDAMASTGAEQVAAVRAEVVRPGRSASHDHRSTAPLEPC